jgi:hypothetical protein
MIMNKPDTTHHDRECHSGKLSTNGMPRRWVRDRPVRAVGFLTAGLAAVALSLLAAEQPVGSTSDTAGASEDWLRGTEEESIRLTSKHLRGFDVTMVETGHRYTELYWAGQDRNWEYADYQLEKIRHVIELGIERRPKRAASAQPFLTNAIPLMKQALEKKEPAAFDSQFNALTAACNVCHVMEKMPFVEIHPPERRYSPVRFDTR